MQGRRIPDGSPVSALEPGDYVRRGSRWWLRLPLDHDRGLAQALDDRWTVTEHADTSVTVSPSIHDRFVGWHGYLERGVWREA
jgi:hypothetical protein